MNEPTLGCLEEPPSAGTAVWVREQESETFARAVATGTTSGARAVVTTLHSQRSLPLPLHQIWPANPAGADDADDVTSLLHLHEPALLHSLRERAARGAIYTSVGRVLLSVNPFRPLPDVYGEARMAEYRDRSTRRPHLYAVGELAYRSIRRDRVAAAIVVSGESGWGKTVASKHLLRYISWRAGGEGGATTGGVAARVLHSTPLFEAFGNAATTRNRNSSRFGKHMDVLLTADGAVAGGRVRTFMLEKTRAAAPPPPGERSFHVLYFLAAGGLLPQARPAQAFRALAAPPAATSSFADASSFDFDAFDRAGLSELLASLDALFVSSEAQQALWRLLGALVLLAEVTFEDDGDGGARVASDEKLRAAEAAFGCPGFASLLLSQPMASPRGGTTYAIALDVRRAATARDSLIGELYRNVFEALVARVNSVVGATRTEGGAAAAAFAAGGGGRGGTPAPKGKGKGGRAIGLLDIFGFECVAVNGFEQLCINYANEALQHFFLQCIFVAEESLHQQEGIDWTKVPFPDNSPLLELLSRPPAAIFPMLDSVSRTPQATDDTFVTQLFQVHHSHAALRRPPAGGGGKSPGNLRAKSPGGAALAAGAGFVLRHYAGDVLYTAAGFAHKNTERLSLELEAAAYTPPDSAARAVLLDHIPLPGLAAALGPDVAGAAATAAADERRSGERARRRARRRRRRAAAASSASARAARARGGRASAAAVRRR